jgi:hypothetical protein
MGSLQIQAKANIPVLKNHSSPNYTGWDMATSKTRPGFTNGKENLIRCWQ